MSAEKISRCYLLKEFIIRSVKHREHYSFLKDACVRWFINQQDLEISPIIVREDLEYYNQNNEKKFKIQKLIDEADREAKRILLMDTVPEIPELKISAADLVMLQKKYTGGNFKRDKKLLLQYYEMANFSSSIHLSMPPIFKGIELFGSPLNTHNPYCSPFEIDRKFGSLGNFFSFTVPEKYLANNIAIDLLCNPPFDERLMSQMVDKLESLLEESAVNPFISIIITIPVWDSETQRELAIHDYGKPFECYEKLCRSRFLVDKKVLDKNTYKYYNYAKKQYIAASYTHLIHLSAITIVNKKQYSQPAVKKLLGRLDYIENRWQKRSDASPR